MYWIRVHFNQDSRFDPYEVGHRVKSSQSGYWPIHEESLRGISNKNRTNVILNDAFRMFNLDDRPNAQIERSLSVGDVISITDEMSTSYWAVEPHGFKSIGAPDGCDDVPGHYSISEHKKLRESNGRKMNDMADATDGAERNGWLEDYKAWAE